MGFLEGQVLGVKLSYQEFIIYSTAVLWIFLRWLDVRQLGRLSNTKRPKHLEKMVEEDAFKSSQEYGAAKLYFSMFRSMVETPKDMYLLFNSTMIWTVALDLAKKIGSEKHEILITSLIFIYLNSLIDLAVGIPFSLYFDFVLEEKFGFNKKTIRLFIMDQLKTQALTVCILGPFMAIFLTLLTYENFVLYVNVFIFVFTFVMMQIYPTLIWPLFNEFSDVTKEGLKDDIQKLCDSVSYPLTGLYEIDGSKRSGHSNAMLYGFCNNKRIVLFDTITKQLNNEEIIAVLCHELGHWQYWHVIQGFVINQVNFFIILGGFSLCSKDLSMYQEFGYSTMIPVIGFTIYSKLLEPVQALMTVIIHGIQRFWEYQADSYAIEHKKGNELITALEKISKENKASLDPDPFYSTYHYTHPPIVDRLNVMRENLKKAK